MDIHLANGMWIELIGILLIPIGVYIFVTDDGTDESGIMGIWCIIFGFGFVISHLISIGLITF